MTLRTRIAVVAGLAVAVAVVSAAVVVYVAVRSQLRTTVDHGIARRLQWVGDPRLDFGPDFVASRWLILRRAEQRKRSAMTGRFGGARGYVQYIRPDGKVVSPPWATAKLPVSPRAKAIARGGSGRYFSDMHVDGVHLRVLTVAPAAGGALQVARPLDEVDSVLGKVLIVLVIIGAAGIMLGAALGAVVARAALAPIVRFTRRSEALALDPALSHRMEVAGGDELARLARSFNHTLDALERSLEAQRQLVADASHELRTPIASVRANIQTLEDAERLPAAERENLRADIVDELDQLTALVGDVVELARGAAPSETPDYVRVDEIVAATVRRARRRAHDDIAIHAHLEPTLINGQPQRIARAAANLLDNALKWSPPGTPVEIALRGGILAVRDHGPGFAEQDLPHVFERFYRAGTARAKPGSGLGLAIVRQTAETHGGWAKAANAPDGGAWLRVNFGNPVPTNPQPAEQTAIRLDAQVT